MTMEVVPTGIMKKRLFFKSSKNGKNDRFSIIPFMCSIYLQFHIFVFQRFSLHEDCGGGWHHPVDDILQNVPENNNNKNNDNKNNNDKGYPWNRKLQI